jgi:tryptophan-specific transport protein
MSARARGAGVLATFAPPLLASVLKPNGFVSAIGFAGCACTFFAVIAPALMVRAPHPPPPPPPPTLH